MSINLTIETASMLSDELLKSIAKLLISKKGKNELINKLPDTKSFTHQEIIKKLQSYYQDKNLVLVLGAGVSMGFGLPNWETLLQKLMLTTIEKEQSVSSVLSKLFTNIFAPSPLIAGRYLQKYYRDKRLVFEEAVRRVLYEDLDIDRPSEIMNEIVNFCASFGKNHSINSIVTYNFDDILEQRLSKLNIEFDFKPIYGIGMNTNGQLPIYHVHGYLPHDGDISDDNQITFGESIYHKQYSDIYSWNNMVQINKFRDSNCLFIGSSLTDPNIRRLLDIANRQKGERDEFHFVFKMRHEEDVIKQRLENLLKENNQLLSEKSRTSMNLNKTVKFLIDIIQRFEESDAASFGVKTIWIDDWTEIPTLMKEIRSNKKKSSR